MIPFLRINTRRSFPAGLFLACLLFAILNIIMLYSAGAGWKPWALKQLVYWVIGLVLFISIAYTDMRFWLFSSIWLYLGALTLLVCVEVLGIIGMGAQRWVNFYFFNLQPSELTKLALILYIAAHFHFLGDRIPRLPDLIIPIFALIFTAVLVLRQPDLGTTIVLIFVTVSMFFAVGVWWGMFALSSLSFIFSFPIIWQFLRDYQKKRILAFLNPSADSLGSGYHLMQSKIAIGSSGFWGKGFRKGTQVQLDFLPEKQTDFIFTLLAEEWGFLGGVFMLTLYAALLMYGYVLAFNTQAMFVRLLVVGLISMLFCHVFMNVGMVLGILPVVGIPLPFMSYGGTSLITFTAAMGWVAAADAQGDKKLPFHG